MPIEIKELHIRIAVTTPQDQQPTENRAANGRNNSGLADGDAKEMFMAECVEQVLQILQEKMER